MGDRPHQPVLECLAWPTSQHLLLPRRRSQSGQVQWSERRVTVAGRHLNADERSAGANAALVGTALAVACSPAGGTLKSQALVSVQRMEALWKPQLAR
jgi:hypothetical protein